MKNSKNACLLSIYIKLERGLMPSFLNIYVVFVRRTP